MVKKEELIKFILKLDSSKKEEDLNELSETDLTIMKVKVELKPGVKGGSFIYKNNSMENSMESKSIRKHKKTIKKRKG